jgi:hypothetical protein
MTQEYDLEAVISKVKKLLAMAGGNANENEASVAAQKAQDLLEAYNLDMAVINAAGRTHTKREKERKMGGLYKWQRHLWNAVATVNFCRYYYYSGNRDGGEYQHELIGSKANVLGTELMARYLEQATERLARKWVDENRPGKSVFIREAIAYREGVAGRITNRLWQLRWDHLRQEKERIEQERNRNRAAGLNTENALVLQDVVNTEEDLNTDFVMGWEPGTSARMRMERDARIKAAEAEADEALRKQAEWDEAHPEEAARRKAAEEAKRAKEYKDWKPPRSRKETPEQQRAKLGSYRDGWDKGGDVSLDRQIDKSKVRRIE